MRNTAFLAASLTVLAAISFDSEARTLPGFDQTIQKVESMVWEQGVNQMVQEQGLSVVNVTWEDTGRSKGSVWGPNISDMTIGVRDNQGYLHPMPVIRFDNFNDVTADINPDKFWMQVGNQRGHSLGAVSLSQLLKDTRSYLHDASSWDGWRSSLWASRDSHVLVSAQACFLPIPQSGEATFTPVLYNYQSYPGNPAVLTMVATREGTSIQVVENDGGYMSEVLYFNEDGQRAPFTATRQSDFYQRNNNDNPGVISGANEDGLNVVLIIQVPLKQKEQQRQWLDGLGMMEDESAGAPMASCDKSRSDVENAVVSHGEVEGPFAEINHLNIERDARFPVRVTVQFYKATSNGVVSRSDIADIRRQIDRVYGEGDYVGSLVTSGWTGRPTEWNTIPEVQDAAWATPTWTWMKTH